MLKELPGFAGFGDIVICGDVIEQTHPKPRQRLVIKIADAVVRREVANLFAHALERLLRRHLVEITQRHRDVRGVSELR